MIKALSIRQPWAWLIVNGFKDIENREWPTRYRGRFQVHAGKTMTRGDYDACRLFCSSIGFDISRIPSPHDLRLGGIVGEAEIVDCVDVSDSPWFVGSNGFVLRSPKVTPFVSCRGALGFFDPVEIARAA